MAQSKKNGSTKAGVYMIGADMVFRSRSGHETDLPQPVDGEARCYIAAVDGDSEPRPYRNRADLESVILEEMRATNFVWPQKDFNDLVRYYEDTWESYSGLASDLFTSINAVERRGRGGLEVLLEAL